MASQNNNNGQNNNVHQPDTPIVFGPIPIDSIEIHLNFEHVNDPDNELRQPVYGPENDPRRLELFRALPPPPAPRPAPLAPPSNPPTPEPTIVEVDDDGDEEMIAFLPEGTEKSTVANGAEVTEASVGSIQFGSFGEVVIAEDAVDSRPSEPSMTCCSRND